jgi:anti-sigma B factor antagonist
MQIVEQRVGNVTILRLAGRLELQGGDLALRDYINGLADQSRINIVLDVKDLTRLDSAGIGMLVSKYLTVRKRGGTIKLLHLTPQTDHLMHITKLSTVFEMFEDELDAVRSFGVTA